MLLLSYLHFYNLKQYKITPNIIHVILANNIKAIIPLLIRLLLNHLN
jgi:hypothetical protein